MERGELSTARGVVEERFVVRRGDREIPGVWWRPETDDPGPLILIGHGGSGSSDEGYVVALARRLVREHAMSCIAIDGPVHGRRRGTRSQSPALVMLDFSQAWASDVDMTDEMIADWRAALDAVLGAQERSSESIGYWGLSMGTILGLPLVAAEPRIEACVLGLAGLTGPTAERLGRDASSLLCPTMFCVQWDDELFGREPVFDLFGAIGAADKQLHATPGRHSAVTPETFSLSMNFLASRLTSPQT